MSDAASILEYYGKGGEGQRLQQGIGQLEFARTKEIITGWLPPVPAVVYDIGGGAGAYAFWLAGLGYEVHLLELSPVNVALAREFTVSRKIPLAAIETADARSINRPSESAEAVLLMGPLYHLAERNDRCTALLEAFRLLKPGGVLFAAGISRYGTLLWALSTLGTENEHLLNPDFLEMVRRELQDGQHIRPQGEERFFTRAYFHLPEELQEEMASAGFVDVDALAVEGPGWIVPDFSAAWLDEQKRAAILQAARWVERDPALMGMSPHHLVVGRKPGR